jgi:putative transposase
MHILAVRLRQQLPGNAGTASSAPRCPKCGSPNVIGFGRRHNRSGSVRRYLCKACGGRFTNREGALRLRFDRTTVALALDLYFRGLSLRKVSDHLRQVHGVRVAPGTLYGWIRRCAPQAARWMDSLGARTGERWHMDETVVKVDGDPRWVWNVVDAETRFLLATHVSRLRRVRDARVLIRHAKAATEDRPLTVLTDGLPAYRRAVGRELAFRSGAEVVNPHKRVPSVRAKLSNNLVERLNGTEKDRLKVMRGLHGRAGPKVLMEGLRVHYNLVQSSASSSGPPGVAAGLPDLGQFRWKEILKRSSEEVPPGQAELEFVVG